MVFIVVNRQRFYTFVATIVFILILLIFGFKPFVRLFFPVNYQTQVQKYATMYNIDPHLAFAVIKAESNFDAKVVSAKGAKGLMQITDDTAKWCADQMKSTDALPQKVLEPDTNINMGCWYISYLYNQSETGKGRLINTLASYNAGKGNVKTWLVEHEKETLDADKIPFPETKGYVKKVLFYYKMYDALYD